jgi:hypothetical protein
MARPKPRSLAFARNDIVFNDDLRFAKRKDGFAKKKKDGDDSPSLIFVRRSYAIFVQTALVWV